MAEVWNGFDKERNLVEGRVLDRADWPYDDDIYHLAVNVWVKHVDGDWLFMRRSPEKSHFPLYYEAGAGGSVLLGESSKQAAYRELLEETGLVADQLQLLFSFTEEQYRTHFDSFLATVSGNKEEIHYQLTETDQHIWVKEENLSDFLENHLVFSNQKKQILTYLAGR